MNWILTLFNRRTVNNISRLFGKKKSNRGMMWASLIGLIITVAAWGAKKNGSNSMQNPLLNIMENMQNRPNANILNAISTSEFSKELLPDSNLVSNK